jgi:hypothetical protein
MSGRDPAEPRSIFNIGTQNAGNISNVAGDMTVHRTQQGQANFTLADAYQDIKGIREVLKTLALPPDEYRAADRAIQDAEKEASKPSPDKRKIAQHLEAFTQIVVKFGALATAGATLIAPLQRLAAWLGPVGQFIVN